MKCFVPSMGLRHIFPRILKSTSSSDVFLLIYLNVLLIDIHKGCTIYNNSQYTCNCICRVSAQFGCRSSYNCKGPHKNKCRKFNYLKGVPFIDISVCWKLPETSKKFRSLIQGSVFRSPFQWSFVSNSDLAMPITRSHSLWKHCTDLIVTMNDLSVIFCDTQWTTNLLGVQNAKSFVKQSPPLFQVL